MKEIFHSENVIYVAPSLSLVKDYLQMVNDIERVGKLIGRTQPISEEDEITWVSGKIKERAPLFSMIERNGGAFIGNIELMNVSDLSAELGVSITFLKQGKGYGTEAVKNVVGYGFKKLGLKRITLRVFPFNQRAKHVYEKCGFSEYDRTEEFIMMEIRR